MKILEANNVFKRYHKKNALNGLDITIEKGKIVGLLGPNGSGKTTFLKLITGLLKPTEGTIKVWNTEIGYKTKQLVSYLPDSEFLYPWMKIKDAQKLYTDFYIDFNTEKFHQHIKFMKLDPDSYVKTLSKGMKEKLALALTISREAKLIILDEPLNGVDPVAREEILESIVKGFSFESSMLITSHLVNEVERILDEVYFIKDGRINLSGETEDLRNEKSMMLDEIYREVFSC